MSKNIQILILILFSLSTINFNAKAQQITDNTINGRYIIIDDFSSFFKEKENNKICYMTIYNILDNESSKPLHIAANELKNVIKFSIKSHSEIYENQRNSKLVINSKNYIETFRTVLIKLDIKYILFNNELLNVDEFYSLVK